MENASLFDQVITSIEFPFGLMLLLIGVVIGMLITWLIWRSRVNNLENQVENEIALSAKHEAQTIAFREEMALKESDLKKASLENIRLRQDLKTANDETSIAQSEAHVVREHVSKLTADNSTLSKKIEGFENQILGLNSKNLELAAEIEKKNAANTNAEVYTLKTKLTKTNSELATALIDVKRLENTIEALKNENFDLKSQNTTTGSTNELGENSDGERIILKSAIPVVKAAEAPKVAKSDFTEKKPAAKKPAKVKSEKVTVKKTLRDDLKKIEGIGPKIEQILNTASILNWKDLAKAKPEDLRKILAEAGNRYKMHNPTTWPEQSALASKGEWDKLKTFQDYLKGGRDPSA